MNLKELFDHIKKEHGLYLTESEIKEIAIICREIEDTRECYNGNKEVTIVIKNSKSTAMKQKIYLSGKISGLPICEAIKNFASVENQLKGFATIINPMRLKHDHDKSWQSYMKEDVKALLECDAIAMLPNFNESKGALIELNLAKSLGFEIIYLKGL